MTRWCTSALLDLPALASGVPAGILGSDCRCWERRVCFPDVDRLDGFVVDLKLGPSDEIRPVRLICDDAILDVDSAYILVGKLKISPNLRERQRKVK